jgi:hypothetical protein
MEVLLVQLEVPWNQIRKTTAHPKPRALPVLEPHYHPAYNDFERGVLVLAFFVYW